MGLFREVQQDLRRHHGSDVFFQGLRYWVLALGSVIALGAGTYGGARIALVYAVVLQLPFVLGPLRRVLSRRRDR